jgi:hypothetical protein
VCLKTQSLLSKHSQKDRRASTGTGKPLLLAGIQLAVYTMQLFHDEPKLHFNFVLHGSCRSMLATPLLDLDGLYNNPLTTIPFHR